MGFKIKQGDAFCVPVKITVNGGPLPVAEVESVEFRFGGVRKLYPEQAAFDPGSGTFQVPLRQEDTLSFPEDDGIQFDVRVKFAGGSVIGTQKVTTVITVDALSEEVL